MFNMDLIKQINLTYADYENNSCIHHKLEHYAYVTPQAIALTYEDQSLTYKDLNQMSNVLAHELLARGITTENPVVVCLERSFHLIISIFGILKAGGTYLPVMPSYPAERKRFIIGDAAPKVVITSRDHAPSFDGSGVTVLLIDNFNFLQSGKTDNPNVAVKSDNLVYIIFTSGTTGNPKGAMIEHHSVFNRIGWMQKAFPITSDDVLIQKTAISFDVSIWELFWWSFTGAKLFLLDQGDEKNPAQLLRQIELHNVSVIHFVPSMLNLFISYLQTIQNKKALQKLKYIFCSGEALNVQSVNNLYNQLIMAGSDALIVNLYGPTEATVDVTYYLCKHNCSGSVPIGKPIDNTQIHIINEQNEILPPGQKGELVICGVNLARGYLNRDSLNKEKFVYLNIFGEQKRAYKTGDIAYYNTDGEIEYIGRNDNQIKLRGFRIELGEIENSIRADARISDCSVIVQHAGQDNAMLVAFYVPAGNTTISGETLKSTLKSRLPEYMVPSQCISISQLPLTGNGKLDKKALIDMLKTQHAEPVAVLSLASTEQILYDIWCELLDTTQIDLESNFFDIGGNSLLVVQMGLLIKEKLGMEIDMFDLFQYTSISVLSTYLFEKAGTS